MAGKQRTGGGETLDDPRWAAVMARDPAAEGKFVYAVRTTGVVCRPTCPSKRPDPRNVLFFATLDEAVLAGFRPCKRCRPELFALAVRQGKLVEELCRFIEGAESMPTLAELAARAGMSPYHLHRVFKSITGLTPKAYALARRAARVRAELARGGLVTAAIYQAGFSSSGRFYGESDRALGMTPSRYRAGGAGMTIRFAIGECSLGAILVAQSERGICAILLGDDADALLRDFQDRFPVASLVGGDPAFERLVARVVGFVEAPGVGLDLPLDVRGTVFQERVWRALRAIPPGERVTYAELARRVGVPEGARAVAQACAANILAVAIPCHRVVRTDGSLSGYRWGVGRKRALLDLESSE